MTRNDLESLRGLRGEIRAFFAACAQGDGEDAAARLNTLLIQNPVHPQLSGHDGQPWHVHYTESGSVADKYAAGAVMGLAVRLTEWASTGSASARRPAARACSSTPAPVTPGVTVPNGA